MQTLEDIIVRFDVDPAHTLKQQNREHVERPQGFYTTCWYVEKNPAGDVIARYRSWSNQTKYPPYRAQLGWERYTPGGTLLEREVRYSKQQDTDTLH